MAPKSHLAPILLALHKAKITTSSSSTRAPVCHVRHLQQNANKTYIAAAATTTPAAAKPAAKPAAASSSSTMGRAGYDTTNMKVATRSRLAGKGKGTGTSDTRSAKHSSLAVSQQQQQQEQQQRRQGEEGAGGTSDHASGKAQSLEQNAGKLRMYQRFPLPRGSEHPPFTPLLFFFLYLRFVPSRWCGACTHNTSWPRPHPFHILPHMTSSST